MNYSFSKSFPRLIAVTSLYQSWGSTSASALKIVACEYQKCTPNCICGFRDAFECAKAYGDYGWKVPDDVDEYVYHHLRPSVSRLKSTAYQQLPVRVDVESDSR